MLFKIIVGDSRKMFEVADGSIDLVITSPPYWQIKNYGSKGQIGFGQGLHDYLKDLYRVWAECLRVLKPGRRLCINIGDQFARSAVYGRYKIIPLHAECISQCEQMGFDFMGSIIWQKKTTMNTTGGAVIMGSFPYPPNGMIEIDYEHILIFKKPGEGPKPSAHIKQGSVMSKEEWKEYFSGHWRFGGAKQIAHQAMFPEELPARLIRMFSFCGDTVLDPFLGSGTTVRAALALGRNGVGYEIDRAMLLVIKEKLGKVEDQLFSDNRLEILVREREAPPCVEVSYNPGIQDAMNIAGVEASASRKDESLKVAAIDSSGILTLGTGLRVKLRGVAIRDEKLDDALAYLKRFVQRHKVLLKYDKGQDVADGGPHGDPVSAYVYLKNKIFINMHLIKSGLAAVEEEAFGMKAKFLKAARQAAPPDPLQDL